MSGVQYLMRFEYEGRAVRTVTVNGEPWLVARDVCEALGIINHRDAVGRIPETMRDDVGISDAMGRTQQTTVISEAGMYKLAFRSNKPEAEAFACWVASDVLPSIRRTGTYGIPAPQFAVPRTFPEALRLAADLAEQVEAQRTTIGLMAPKADFFDAVAAADGCQSIREVAKVLGTGQNRMFDWLRGQAILMVDNRPYQEYLDRGYFRVIEQTWTDREGQPHLTTKTLVTGKGLTWLQKRFHSPAGGPAELRVAE